MRRTDTLPTKSADRGQCAEAPPPAPDGYANAVSAVPEQIQEFILRGPPTNRFSPLALRERGGGEGGS